MNFLKQIKYLRRFFLRKLFLTRNWYIPNFKKIIRKKIVLNGPPPCFNQYTIISGRGKLIIGKKCVFGFKLGGRHRHGSIELQPRYENALIKIGNNIATNNNLFICAARYIEIGDNTLIGEGVTIFDFEAHGIHPDHRREIGETGTIKIGNNVWIGNNVTILKNTIIGDNTIVAAGAVVSGNFPADVLVGGIPAKVIKDL